MATDQRCQKPKPCILICCGCWCSSLCSALQCSVGLLILQASSAWEFFLWRWDLTSARKQLLLSFPLEAKKKDDCLLLPSVQHEFFGMDSSHTRTNTNKPQVWSLSLEILPYCAFLQHWKSLKSISTNVPAFWSQDCFQLFSCWCFTNICEGPLSRDLEGRTFLLWRVTVVCGTKGSHR